MALALVDPIINVADSLGCPQAPADSKSRPTINVADWDVHTVTEARPGPAGAMWLKLVLTHW
jgi:hypothetical protein